MKATSPLVEAARALLGRKVAALLPLHWAEVPPEGVSAQALAVCQHLDPTTPTNAECANFISAVLRATGMLAEGAPIASVPDLRTALEASGRRAYTATDWARMPPGSVVVLQTRDFDGRPDPDGHVVLFTGVRNAEPWFLGANPIDEAGSPLEQSGAQVVNELPRAAFQAWLGACFAVTAVYSPSAG